MKCSHKNIRCLNHFDIFRKYLCEDCGNVFICECEKELTLTFLPHQTNSGSKSETNIRYKVDGFFPGLCSSCRGLREEAHPVAPIYGRKGKIQRYYWREIFKTYCLLSMEWLRENNITIKDLFEFQSKYPDLSKKYEIKAKKYWQEQHKLNPLYNTKEITESEFLSQVKIEKNEIYAEYVSFKKENQKIGKWKNSNGEICSAEDIAAEHYTLLDFDVWKCERKLISTLVGTFFSPIIQDTNDPRVRIVMRGSTYKWFENKDSTPVISFPLPEDFGSQEYFKRRKKSIMTHIDKIESSSNLIDTFNEFLPNSITLLDYLWVNDDYAINLTKRAIEVIPQNIIIKFIIWAIGDFWNRNSGWPDLLAFKDDNYKFVEVKSPHDELSLDQMNWFKWVVNEIKIPCEICRLKKKS